MAEQKEFLKFPPKERGRSFGITENYLSYFGGHNDFLDWFYQGIRESKLTKNTLEILNGKEIIAFGIGNWVKKVGVIQHARKGGDSLRNAWERQVDIIEPLGSLELFESYIKTGNPIYEAQRDGIINMSRRVDPIRTKSFLAEQKIMNPYKEELSHRIASVSDADIEMLKSSLGSLKKEYVSTKKMRYVEDNRGFDTMTFELAVKPFLESSRGVEKGSMQKEYAESIVQRLKCIYSGANI